MDKIFEKLSQAPNLESALLGPGFIPYYFYRIRYFLLFTFFFFCSFFVKFYFLSDEYSNYYISEIMQYEHWAFWVAQLVWAMLLLDNYDQTNNLIKSRPNYMNFSKSLTLAIVLFFSIFLYRKGVLVFNRLTIYGSISIIFLLQLVFLIRLKAMHATIYLRKRIFVNGYFIILIHLVCLILQISLWKKYDYWSVVIAFGIQMIMLSLLRYFYYWRDFSNISLSHRSETFRSIFNKQNFLLGIGLILPEIALFLFLNFNFLDRGVSSFYFLIFGSLINSRVGFLFIQDFLKYHKAIYSSIVMNYFYKIIFANFFTSLSLHLFFLVLRLFFVSNIPFKIVLLSISLLMLLSIQGSLYVFYFANKNSPKALVSSFLTVISIVIGLVYFKSHEYFLANFVIYLCIFFLLINEHMNPFKMNKAIQFTRSFDQLKSELNTGYYKFQTSFVLNIIGMNHEIMTDFLKKLCLEKTFVYINSNKRVYILSQNEISVDDLFFYVSDVKSEFLSTTETKSTFSNLFIFKSEHRFANQELKNIFNFIFKDNKTEFTKNFSKNYNSSVVWENGNIISIDITHK